MKLNPFNFTQEELNKAETFTKIVKNLTDMGMYKLEDIQNFINVANGLEDTKTKLHSNVNGIVDRVIYDTVSSSYKIYVIDEDNKAVHIYGKVLEVFVIPKNIVKEGQELGTIDRELYYDVTKLENYYSHAQEISCKLNKLQ